MRNVDSIFTLSFLKNFDMVIVTQAKTLSNNQIQLFYDYVNSTNGVLIWTGDAGTNYMPDDKKVSNFKDLNLPNHPWVRVVEENKILDLRTMLSAEYVGNFCSLVNCSNDLKDMLEILHSYIQKKNLLLQVLHQEQIFRRFCSCNLYL